MTQATSAFRFSEYGDASVLNMESLELVTPAAGEIQIEQDAIGVNFIDIYHRKGVFAAQLPLPAGLGMEGVGTITALGEDVSGLAIGDRVAYVGGPPNAYSQHRNLPAARALKVPSDLSSEMVAALIFKGLTVEYLTHRCCNLGEGDVVLWHAAAGGVGTIASQWLASKGVSVIGTVSSAIKADMAKANGCTHVINYKEEDFEERVKEITNGKGVDVVYDSVGADTFTKSMNCLRPRGTLVSFGEASGLVDALPVSMLGAKGSLYITRPSIAHYTADRGEYEQAAENLFAAIRSGAVKSPEITTYPLVDAARAHTDMEERRTTGSIILQP
ncbi:quinone oxidoreductase family protein [Cohaesibacter gelatinilyticus]|uniref:NADPH2:quinone reductase n=1 Tax=Cohaesibacter gelatinilyticus TaxID=372072 RepID=A0A285PBV3_9HYPH|nr:quinone oxidoreductase [Cohaesibacter gelatinilyticus]SNZ19205.1 NADPH2:quinone reductase [Cohaesibacter gelatinilyticus]